MAFRRASWSFMLSGCRQHIGLAGCFSGARYHLNRFPLSMSFSSVAPGLTSSQEFGIDSNFNVDESSVINELSEIFPISRITAMPNLSIENHAEKQVPIGKFDRFLLPEDKLRGVFLQKLKGKAAIEYALASAGVDLSSDVVAKVLNRGNLGGKAMVIFFNWAIEQPLLTKDTYTYHIILKALGRRKFFKYMVEILHDMKTKEVIADMETLSIVVDSFVSARHVSHAVQMFGKLEEVGLKCDTESFNVLLKCLCRRSHVGAANSIMDSMKEKVQFSSLTYNILIGGWSRYGRVGEIERILITMKEDGFLPDCITFTHLIEGLGRAGQIQDAVKVFNSLMEKGCVPDVSVYNAMISNFISVGNINECMVYYRLMLFNQCQPNIETYTKVVTAFLKSWRVADALEMFDEMLGRGVIPTTGAVTSFIKLLCGYGPPHASMLIYKKARKAGCKISESAYKLLLMRLSRFGKCGMLLAIWNEMQESGYSLDVKSYECLINGLCNKGQLENAVLVAEECLNNGFCPSKLICSKLNNKLLASNKVQVAYKLFLKIKNARRYESMVKQWRSSGWHI